MPTRCRLILLTVGALAVGSLRVDAGGPQAASQSLAPPSDSWQQALLDRYCVTCHNSQLRTAGLTLDSHDVTRVGDAPAVWETVVRKLRAGGMPPLARPRPDTATYDRFITWLESELDQAAVADLDPGRTEAFHRLNRTEYHNAVRDLLALEVDVSELLPADGSSYGFDNIAGVLGISPALLERYLAAARKISRLAVGRPALSATTETFRLASDLPQDDWVDGMPFGTRGGGAFRYTFPEDADYVLRVRLSRDAGDVLGVFTVPHTLEVSLDGTPVQTFTVGEPPPADTPRSSDAYRAWRERQRNIDRDWEVRVPVKAGTREVRLTFLRKTWAYPETLRQPYLRPYTSITGGDTRYQPYLGSVSVTVPFDASGAPPMEETPSRQRIFVCRPALSGLSGRAAEPVRRLGWVYIPNGMVMPSWTPPANTTLELSSTLSPLASFRDRMVVVSGLAHPQAEALGCVPSSVVSSCRNSATPSSRRSTVPSAFPTPMKSTSS